MKSKTFLTGLLIIFAAELAALFIFAAGDVRSKPLRQIVTAVADGANAIAGIQNFL